MISLEELKPILEPLLTAENSADIISQIQAIDKPSEVNIEEVEKKLNAEWNEKFKKAFLENKGVPETPQTPSQDDAKNETEDKEEPEKPKTFDDLFKVEKED